jgi:hypothetical protein
LKNLVVQIFTVKKGVVLIAFDKDVFGHLGYQYRKRKTENNEDNEAGIGKKLDQSELPFLWNTILTKWRHFLFNSIKGISDLFRKISVPLLYGMENVICAYALTGILTACKTPFLFPVC